MPFYFYDMIYATKKISACQEFHEPLIITVLDQFQRGSSVGYSE